MFIEIGAPAVLPLALVQLEDKNCLLGITLQHPPVHLFAQAYQGLQISGARADKAYEQAEQFLRYHRLAPNAEIEIELAIPSQVGLGSETVLGLSVARALAWINNLPFADTGALAQALGLKSANALEVCGFDQGGLLLVDLSAQSGPLPQPLYRAEISHPDKNAWAFVLFFPRIPDDTPDALEADRLEMLLSATPYLSPDSGRLVVEQLWPAVSNADPATFGHSLLTLQQLNQEALTRGGAPLTFSDSEQAVLDLMRDHGALAWGRSLTGLGLYGLVKGAKASVDLRKKLRDHVGFFGGIVMAAITDNRGAHSVFNNYDMAKKILK